MNKKGISSEELDALLGKDSSVEDKKDINRKMDLILNFPLEVSVRIGDTYMRIDEILELSTGNVIDLNKMLDEPVDLLVNGKSFAKGEILAMGEYFGIRITSIIQPVDRIEKLR